MDIRIKDTRLAQRSLSARLRHIIPDSRDEIKKLWKGKERMKTPQEDGISVDLIKDVGKVAVEKLSRRR